VNIFSFLRERESFILVSVGLFTEIEKWKSEICEIFEYLEQVKIMLNFGEASFILIGSIYPAIKQVGN